MILTQNQNKAFSYMPLMKQLNHYNKISQIKMQWQEKLCQLSKLEKTHQTQYLIIKSLNEAFQESALIATKSIFQYLYTHISSIMQKLHIYKKLSYQIWRNQDFAIQLRQKSSILYIISQWIVNFQIKMSSIKSIGNQFGVLKQFIQNYCKSYEEKVILIDEIYQDLKQTFQDNFWSDLSIQNVQQSQVIQIESQEAKQIISLLQILVQKEMVIIKREIIVINKSKNLQFCLQSSYFYNNNYYDFVLRCLHYLLSSNLNNSLQTQVTKICLFFIQSSFTLHNHQLIIDLLKKLMISTKKAVRLALITQYIEIYDFFKVNECVQILEEIQEIVFFRQLIISYEKFQSLELSKQCDQYPIEVFTSLYVKAGSKQRIFFSNEQSQLQLLKLQVLIDERVDITLRIYHFTKNKQEVYHTQQKSGSRQLQILIKFKGLYALQFDNVYSWIVGKEIKYKLSLYKQIKK